MDICALPSSTYPEITLHNIRLWRSEHKQSVRMGWNWEEKLRFQDGCKYAWTHICMYEEIFARPTCNSRGWPEDRRGQLDLRGIGSGQGRWKRYAETYMKMLSLYFTAIDFIKNKFTRSNNSMNSESFKEGFYLIIIYSFVYLFQCSEIRQHTKAVSAKVVIRMSGIGKIRNASQKTAGTANLFLVQKSASARPNLLHFVAFVWQSTVVRNITRIKESIMSSDVICRAAKFKSFAFRLKPWILGQFHFFKSLLQ